MSAREREPRARWPGMKWHRRRHNRRDRAKARADLRARREPDTGHHKHSAKWEVW